MLAASVDQLLAAVPDIDAPESSNGVDIALVVGVPNIDALAALEDQRAMLGELLEIRARVEMVSTIELL